MLERDSEMFRSSFHRQGVHYNLYEIKGGIAALKSIFPDGKANEMNFALFSTSGVHGTYTTIEEIEVALQKYPDGPPEDGGDWPDDYRRAELTVLIIQPRICCLRYGTVEVTAADIPYLKTLRETSWLAVQQIGKGE